MTKSGMPDSGRKVKGTIHWVSEEGCFDAEVRLYDRLFMVENPADDERDFRELLNPDSLKVLKGCKMESYLKDAKEGDKFQFQRTWYFCVDKDSTPENMVFNRTVSLKDSWAKAKDR
jgi:glutaminyl-tRNA synthetase